MAGKAPAALSLKNLQTRVIQVYFQHVADLRLLVLLLEGSIDLGKVQVNCSTLNVQH